jgi:hypothetical protein
MYDFTREFFRPARQPAGHLLRLALLMLASIAVPTAQAQELDFDTQLQTVSLKLQALMPTFQQKLTAGDLAGGNAILLDAFPAATRTPVESFMLGNILFEMDRKQSYALHQAAARGLPNHPHVIWEWAMEQHRAGKYEAALADYQKYSKSFPNLAIPYAMQADCLLRLGRMDEAAKAWHQSEMGRGSIEEMENLVCSIHREPAPLGRRSELLASATRKHDVQTAMALISLDCDFENDWWHRGPMRPFLDHDLPAVAKALGLPPDDFNMRAMSCAAACATAKNHDKETITKILQKYRMLTDADHTLPDHPGLMELILKAAILADAVDQTVLHDQIAPRVLAMARTSKDVHAWSAAAMIVKPEDKPGLMKIGREAWQSCADPRFAALVLSIKQDDHTLAGKDPELKAAIRQFPGNAPIQRIAYEVAVRENDVTKPLLADTAKAEFNHFSSFVAFATAIDRPRSDYLREYFAKMLKMPAAAKTAGKP